MLKTPTFGQIYSQVFFFQIQHNQIKFLNKKQKLCVAYNLYFAQVLISGKFP